MKRNKLLSIACIATLILTSACSSASPTAETEAVVTETETSLETESEKVNETVGVVLYHINDEAKESEERTDIIKETETQLLSLKELGFVSSDKEDGFLGWKAYSELDDTWAMKPLDSDTIVFLELNEDKSLPEGYEYALFEDEYSFSYKDVNSIYRLHLYGQWEDEALDETDESSEADAKKETESTTETEKVATENNSEKTASDQTDSDVNTAKSKDSTKTGNSSSSKSKDSNSSSKTSDNKSNSSSSSSQKSSSGSSSSSSGSKNSGSSSSGGTKSSSSSSSASKGSGSSSSGGGSTQKETSHTHNWVAQTKTVHHDEVGHYETVVVQAAYDEEVENITYRSICNRCGMDTTGFEVQHATEVIPGEYDEYGIPVPKCGGSWALNPVTTYKTVHHDAVTEQKWVVDKAAYDETVTTGYKCSGCGATK